jgi:hypothetical protein
MLYLTIDTKLRIAKIEVNKETLGNELLKPMLPWLITLQTKF